VKPASFFLALFQVTGQKLPKAVGAKGNPGGQRAKIVRDPNGIAQDAPTLAELGVTKKRASRAMSAGYRRAYGAENYVQGHNGGDGAFAPLSAAAHQSFPLRRGEQPGLHGVRDDAAKSRPR
jgi:hypothetical protein